MTPSHNLQEYPMIIDDHLSSDNDLTSETTTIITTLETSSTELSTTTTLSTTEMDTIPTDPPFIEKCQIANDNSDRCGNYRFFNVAL